MKIGTSVADAAAQAGVLGHDRVGRRRRSGRCASARAGCSARSTGSCRRRKAPRGCPRWGRSRARPRCGRSPAARPPRSRRPPVPAWVCRWRQPRLRSSPAAPKSRKSPESSASPIETQRIPPAVVDRPKLITTIAPSEREGKTLPQGGCARDYVLNRKPARWRNLALAMWSLSWSPKAHSPPGRRRSDWQSSGWRQRASRASDSLSIGRVCNEGEQRRRASTPIV